MFYSNYLFLLLTLTLPFLSHGRLAKGNPESGSQFEPVVDAYFKHSSGQRINTDTVMFETLCKVHTSSFVTTINRYNANLIAFALASGEATATELDREDPRISNFGGGQFSRHVWTFYVPPEHRTEGNGTTIYTEKYAVYLYMWRNQMFLVYVTDYNDGAYPSYSGMQYIVTDTPGIANDLILHAGKWTSSLHDEIWVFDGYWSKNRVLWNDIQHSDWDDVILDKKMKAALQSDVFKFFDSKEQYRKVGVPWKRGVIFYGPPGNGKTISIKATMKSLYSRSDPIPTLYVKTLRSIGGPEYSVSQIFQLARTEAPCLLVFEDLDSLVTPLVRSYFLNQVDGIQPNDGILMIGSTNHLELLDPGIARRPSRFDRKYLFPNPSLNERIQYCEFWKTKLEKSGDADIEFPHVISEAIANITDGFSFAYMQEAFIAALLEITRDSDVNSNHKDDLDKYILWRVIKKQIAILRHELEQDDGSSIVNHRNLATAHQSHLEDYYQSQLFEKGGVREQNHYTRFSHEQDPTQPEVMRDFRK